MSCWGMLSVRPKSLDLLDFSIFALALALGQPHLCPFVSFF